MQRWSWYVFRVFMLQLWGFLSKKLPHPPKKRKKGGVIFVCSGLERIEKSLKIHKNGWLCEALESWKFLHSQPSLVHDKWDIFWLTSFESYIRACITSLRVMTTFSRKIFTSNTLKIEVARTSLICNYYLAMQKIVCHSSLLHNFAKRVSLEQ